MPGRAAAAPPADEHVEPDALARDGDDARGPARPRLMCMACGGFGGTFAHEGNYRETELADGTLSWRTARASRTSGSNLSFQIPSRIPSASWKTVSYTHLTLPTNREV